MMSNGAEVTTAKGATFHEYAIYRMTIISRLPTLRLLDDREVDEEEAVDAVRMFPLDEEDTAVQHERTNKGERALRRTVDGVKRWAGKLKLKRSQFDL